LHRTVEGYAGDKDEPVAFLGTVDAIDVELVVNLARLTLFVRFLDDAIAAEHGPVDLAVEVAHASVLPILLAEVTAFGFEVLKPVAADVEDAAWEAGTVGAQLAIIALFVAFNDGVVAHGAVRVRVRLGGRPRTRDLA